MYSLYLTLSGPDIVVFGIFLGLGYIIYKLIEKSPF